MSNVGPVPTAPSQGTLPAPPTAPAAGQGASPAPPLGSVEIADALGPVVTGRVTLDASIKMTRNPGGDGVTLSTTPGGATITLAGDVTGPPGSTVVQSLTGSGGVLPIAAATERNTSQPDGQENTTLAELKTTDNAAHDLLTFAVPASSFVQWDIEIVAIKGDHTIGGWWKKSLAYLNNAGAVTLGTPRNVDAEFVGGAPTWSVTLTNTGATARVSVNSMGDTVTWYVIAQSLRIAPAP